MYFVQQVPNSLYNFETDILCVQPLKKYRTPRFTPQRTPSFHTGVLLELIGRGFQDE